MAVEKAVGEPMLDADSSVVSLLSVSALFGRSPSSIPVSVLPKALLEALREAMQAIGWRNSARRAPFFYKLSVTRKSRCGD